MTGAFAGPSSLDPIGRPGATQTGPKPEIARTDPEANISAPRRPAAPKLGPETPDRQVQSSTEPGFSASAASAATVPEASGKEKRNDSGTESPFDSKLGRDVGTEVPERPTEFGDDRMTSRDFDF